MDVRINLEDCGTLREAIPVRAIPFLASWRFISPDEAAHLFAEDDGCELAVAHKLASWKIEAGRLRRWSRAEWAEWAVRPLQALSDEITAAEPTREAGYARWRKESIAILPAGAFVWSDELRALHRKVWDRKHRSLTRSVSFAAEETIDEDSSPTEADRSADSRQFEPWLRQSLHDLEDWRELDFHPFVPTGMATLIMEGFPWVTQFAEAGKSPEIDELYRRLQRLNQALHLWKDVSAATTTALAHKLTRTRAIAAEISEIRDNLDQIRDGAAAAMGIDRADEQTFTSASRAGGPRVFWRYQLADNLHLIDAPTKATAKDAISWLIRNSGGRIRKPTVLDDPYAAIEWRDDLDTWHPVKKQTVSNTLSALRKRRQGGYKRPSS
jgi:hypothetical protein